MTWHIFAKDLRRLWPYVAALAALHLVMAIVRAKLGPFPADHPELRGASQILGILTGAMVFFAAVLVVQLDPLPDDRQDWLARPIRRRDLLAAKLLFIVLMVQAPMFAADMVQALMGGFSFGQALGAAAAWNLFQFVNPVLPALAVAAMTRTIGQTLGLGSAVLGACGAVVGGIVWLLSDAAVPAANLVSWLVWTCLLLAGATAILGLQYFRRDTVRSRVVFVVFASLILGSQLLLPESTALAMQHWLAPAPNLSLAFTPEVGKLAKPSGAEGPRFSEQNVRITLPLRVENLPPELMLVAEGVRAKLIAPNGQTQEAPGPQDVVLHMPGEAPAPFHLVLYVPKAFFRAHAGQPLRVTLDYRLGVLAPRGHYEMPASGGELRLPEGVSCASRINNPGTAVMLGCLQAGEVHARIAAVLTDRAGSGEGNWSVRHLPSEAPYSNGSDMITQFSLYLSLGGATQLPRVAIVAAQPLTHLLRQVTIPALQLADWAADGPGAMTGGSEDRP